MSDISTKLSMVLRLVRELRLDSNEYFMLSKILYTHHLAMEQKEFELGERLEFP